MPGQPMREALSSRRLHSPRFPCGALKGEASGRTPPSICAASHRLRNPDPCRLQSSGPPRQRKLHAARGPTPASAHSHAVTRSCLHEGLGPGSWAMLNHVYEGQRAACLKADFAQTGIRLGSSCRIAAAAPDARCTAANMMRPLSRVRADKKAGNDFSL